MNSTEEILTAFSIGVLVGTFLLNTGRYRKSIELLKECLVLLNSKVVTWGEFYYLKIYNRLSLACQNSGNSRQAKEYIEKALAISLKIGNRREEGANYCDLGNVFVSLGEYVKARQFLERALAISLEIGYRHGEVACYRNLGYVYQFLGEYVKARKVFEKALAISLEIDERRGEAAGLYGNLGNVCEYLGEYVKAREFHEKALAISIEIGDRSKEVACYANFGMVYQSLCEYVKARESLEKALAVSIEIGDRHREGANYGNLGNVYYSLGEYVKAREYHERALAITIETGHRHGEGACYNSLGNVYQRLGEYVKAKEFHEKALAICTETGDTSAEGACYTNLGRVYQQLGEYEKAKELLERAFAISIELGDRKGEGTDYDNIGTVCKFLGDYVKAKVCFDKALAISIEIGDRWGKASQYDNLGNVFQSLGEYEKAKEFHDEALAIRIEIGDKCGEAACYGSLGNVYSFLGFDGLAEEYHKKGLAIAIELGTVDLECNMQVRLALFYVSMMRMEEALACLSAAVERLEDLRGFLGEHDLYKINFADQKKFPYNLLALMLCSEREITEALLVSELGRARALADLMSAQYSLKRLSNRLTLDDIEQTMRKEESTCTGLYISFFLQTIPFWVLKTNKKVFFQKINKDALESIPNCHESSLQDCVESLANQSYRHLAVLEGECEDRSLLAFYEREAECQARVEEKPASCRLVEEYDEDQKEEPALRSLYRLIISPVADLLEGSEIIICPPPSLYQFPFPALMDGHEKPLSEKYRIRLIPSLTTLKLIKDSPADYHSQTGALIVGDPDVGRTGIPRLPGAKEEAGMIGRLLHVQPLIGPEATKQAVLHSMRSVSLIHIAAHGDATRGEIALAPLRPMDSVPVKEDFMLTMSDVSDVRLRAKLVVLSCCHSGRGNIRAEGVIGIARAFLGSGARSVLVSLWAVDDRATKEFMREFYEHLSRGESASECLHEAMKWMRGRPQYCAVRQWAPFVLIGDNVTFNFEELTRDQRSNST